MIKKPNIPSIQIEVINSVKTFRFNISTSIRRIFLYCKQVSNTEEDFLKTKLEIPYSEFVNLYGLKNKKLTDEITSITYEIAGNYLEIIKDGGFIRIPFLKEVLYRNEYIYFEFNEDLEPYLIDLQSQLTNTLLEDRVKD